MAPPRRPALLIALQTEATALFSLVIAQAGFAAAFIGGQDRFFPFHAVNAYVIAAASVVLVITAAVHHRRGGPRWPLVFALIIVVLEVAQITIGLVELASAHIFLGVLFVVACAMITSYLFRPGFHPAAPGDVTDR